MQRSKAGSLATVARRQVVLFIGVISLIQIQAQAQPRSMRTHHMREEVSARQAAFVGRLPATQSLKLSIALPLRNEAELDEELQRLYDPNSPSYHQFLSVEQFTER